MQYCDGDILISNYRYDTSIKLLLITTLMKQSRQPFQNPKASEPLSWYVVTDKATEKYLRMKSPGHCVNVIVFRGGMNYSESFYCSVRLLASFLMGAPNNRIHPESCKVIAMFSFTECVSLDVLHLKSLIAILLLLSLKNTDVSLSRFLRRYYWCKKRRNALTFGPLPWLMCKVLISRENTVKLPYGSREVAACQVQLQSRTFATANVCQDSLCQVLYVNVG